jgi:hypothetical protein
MENLPKLQDLYSGSVELVKENNLNILLNQEPKKAWVKDHPFAKGIKYIPIEVVEYLMTSIFIHWSVEVKTVQVVANSMVVTIRLHYRNPVGGDMRWQDGIGACPIQTDKDANATDFTKIKSDAIMKAAPAAESYAIKDAAEKLGKLFGKDLNRKDAFGYTALGNKFDMMTPEQGNYIDMLHDKTSLSDEQLAEMDYELSQGVTSERAAQIINNLEMNRNNAEPDLSTQKEVNNTLNFKIDDLD